MNRFDRWTRDYAMRISRRGVSRRERGGGGGAAALRVAPNVQAQASCDLTVHAETGAGPSAPAVYDGRLLLDFGADGSIAGSSFSGARSTVARISGRALDFEIVFPNGEIIAFSGVGTYPLAFCQGAVTGLFTGPQPGDLGGWRADPDDDLDARSVQVDSIGNPPSSGPVCEVPSFSCGANCCPDGADCVDTNQGICVCPDGTIQCGLGCVAACADGQILDLDRCRCSSDCAGLDCGVLGCVDSMVDPANCGGCGTSCASGVCVDGVCSCLPDGASCQSSSDCCSQQCPPAGICGCAQLGQSCSDDFWCCAGAPVICLGGACCISNGFACNADADCCDYLQGNGACTNGICVRLS